MAIINLNVNLRNKTVKEIEEKISSEIIGHVRPRVSLNINGLFRVRRIEAFNKDEYQTAKCIWYPDWAGIDEKKYKLERCSDKGQNFFYSSNSLECAIREIDPKNESIVLIGEFHQIDNDYRIKSQFAGIETLKLLENWSSDLGNYIYKSTRDFEIEKFISMLFQRRIPDSMSYLYKPTIAFCNILLRNDDIGCVIYPSVSAGLKFVNYGIKAHFVDKHLYCNNVFIYKIKRTDKSIELYPQMFGDIDQTQKKLGKDAIINWAINESVNVNTVIKYSL